MKMREKEDLWKWTSLLALMSSLILLEDIILFAEGSNVPMKGSFSYTGGKSKELSPQGPFSTPVASPSSPGAAAGSASSLAATSYYEPRGDYGGGYGSGGGVGGGGFSGGWGGGGGGGHSVYQYSLHQPQPYYHPAPVYYEEGGFEGVEKGLLGLLGLSGLTGLKGLLGLLGLLKLLLPLLGLLLPLLLPLLLLKAAALLALLLLIPVPVITTGTTGRRITSFEEGKAFLKDTLIDLVSKIPTDMNHVISKIRDSSAHFSTNDSPKPKKELRSSKSITLSKSSEEKKDDKKVDR